MVISTIRFRGVFAGLRSTRKRYKAADYLRTHIARLNKSDASLVSIDPRLNVQIMHILQSGDPIKVDIVKSGSIIKVKLAGEAATPPSASAATPKPQSAADAAKPEVKKADTRPSRESGKTTERPDGKSARKKGPIQNAESAKEKQNEGKPSETKNQA